ncbi:MAG: peroxidase family protein, partial [Methyloligellaceae bacterium]
MFIPRLLERYRGRENHIWVLAGMVGAFFVTSNHAFAQSSHHGSRYLSPELYSESFKAPEGSKSYKGFGRLFTLQSTGGARGHQSQSSAIVDLKALGKQMVEPKAWANRRERYSKMPAGYTFFGQFIDHDITLDTISKLDSPVKKSEIENARTVDLDLDCIYGGGPERMPFLYNLPYLKIGKQIPSIRTARPRYDLLRTSAGGQPNGGAVAIIGDPRNDENFIVSQLQSAFIAFHNRIVDKLVEVEYGKRRGEICKGAKNCSGVRALAAALPGSAKGEIFEKARDHVIHYYHRIIVEDFIPRLIGADRADDIRKNGRNFYFPKGFVKKNGELATPFIPIEFSVAAYRYGHGQVRQLYRLRSGKKDVVPLFRPSSRKRRGIRGFGEISPNLVVDWRYFFGIDRKLPRNFNFASKITPFMPRFLHDLASVGVTGSDEPSLAARNLNRGRVYRLPSGQSIASVILPVLEKRGILSNWAVLDSR